MIRTPTLSPVPSWLHTHIKTAFLTMVALQFTARAGNVIGGDFANDRIIPDCIRAAIKHEDIVVRNPFSTRPYQHHRSGAALCVSDDCSNAVSGH